MNNGIRVYILAGNARERDALAAVIRRSPGMTLVGTGNEPDLFTETFDTTKLDALLLDIDTFDGDPVDLVRQIMRQNPLPIILMSASQRDTDVVFEGISAGALTVVKKPYLTNTPEDDILAAKVLRDIKTYSAVVVIRHVRGGDSEYRERMLAARDKYAPEGRIVVIASSTGGPQALKVVLSALPASFPAGLVIAQHISQGFTPGLTEWLDNICSIKVKEARDGENIKPGTAYFAPDGYHIAVRRFELIGLDNGSAIAGHRPSCNKLLKSAADVYHDKAVGVILSGMGEDGAVGLKAIRDTGGKTFAQDEESCAVFGMPKIALDIGAVDRTTSLDIIASELVRAML